MTKATFIALLFIHLCQSGRIPREVGEKCTTPNSEAGECRNIKNCSVLLNYVKEHDEESAALLRDSNCGFEGTDTLVCCPDLSSRLTPWDPYSRDRDRYVSRDRYSSTPGYWELGSDSRERDRDRYSTSTRRSTTSNNHIPNREGTSSQCGKSSFSLDRIVGGDPASLGAWPWVAALGYKSRTKTGIQWLCGGALVTNQHVITAGHCVVIPADKTLTVVRLGDLDLNDNVADGASPVDVPVDRTIPHTEYRSSAKVNDIAIVKLRNTVQFSDYIQPICLPNTSQLRSNILVGKTPFVAGWGALFFRGPATKALQQVDVSVTDEESCRTAYQNQRGAVIDSRVLCAGKPGKDACQGDSGGPLMLDEGATYYLIGVVSYGKNCAEPGYPGVYTKVASFMDWVNRNLN